MASPNDLDEIDVSERIIEEILPFKIHKKRKETDSCKILRREEAINR